MKTWHLVDRWDGKSALKEGADAATYFQGRPYFQGRSIKRCVTSSHVGPTRIALLLYSCKEMAELYNGMQYSLQKVV